MSIAKHYETGEPLPEQVYQKLLAARTFRAGSLSLRQVCSPLFFGSFAMNCKRACTASALVALFLDVESAHDAFSNNFQVHFAVVDLELHTNYVPGGSETIYDVDQKVGKRTQIIPPLPEDRFLCSFSHIFAGGSSSLSSSSFFALFSNRELSMR